AGRPTGPRGGWGGGGTGLGGAAAPRLPAAGARGGGRPPPPPPAAGSCQLGPLIPSPPTTTVFGGELVSSRSDNRSCSTCSGPSGCPAPRSESRSPGSEPAITSIGSVG